MLLFGRVWFLYRLLFLCKPWLMCVCVSCAVMISQAVDSASPSSSGSYVSSQLHKLAEEGWVLCMCVCMYVCMYVCVCAYRETSLIGHLVNPVCLCNLIVSTNYFLHMKLPWQSCHLINLTQDSCQSDVRFLCAVLCCAVHICIMFMCVILML